MTQAPRTAPVETGKLRTTLASAAVMLLVFAAAVVLGEPWLAALVWVVAAVALGEFVRLVALATDRLMPRVAAIAVGAIVFGTAAWILATLDSYFLVAAVGTVAFTDAGAFLARRAFGARRWVGVTGGVLLAAAWLGLVAGAFHYTSGYATLGEMWAAGYSDILSAVGIGALLALVAQAGDAAGAWLKRKAGVERTSRLIPGHGGVLDRVDGLIPLALGVGLLSNAA